MTETSNQIPTTPGRSFTFADSSRSPVISDADLQRSAAADSAASGPEEVEEDTSLRPYTPDPLIYGDNAVERPRRRGQEPMDAPGLGGGDTDLELGGFFDGYWRGDTYIGPVQTPCGGDPDDYRNPSNPSNNASGAASAPKA